MDAVKTNLLKCVMHVDPVIMNLWRNHKRNQLFLV